uniref:Uncharacterized protein n=1 Tax=Romanomermis culicivorax TaxID=13658 RepID=A0A915IWB9_ROMCU
MNLYLRIAATLPMTENVIFFGVPRRIILITFILPERERILFKKYFYNCSKLMGCQLLISCFPKM